MISQKDIWINYEGSVLEKFIPIERDMWVIFSNNDGSYIWACRCVGYFKVVDTPYNKSFEQQDYNLRRERDYNYEYAVIDPMESPEPLPSRYMGGKIVGITFHKPSIGDVRIDDCIDLTTDVKLKEKLVELRFLEKQNILTKKEENNGTKTIFQY